MGQGVGVWLCAQLGVRFLPKTTSFEAQAGIEPAGSRFADDRVSHFATEPNVLILPQPRLKLKWLRLKLKLSDLLLTLFFNIFFAILPCVCSVSGFWFLALF